MPHVQQYHRACHLCEAICGLIITTEDNEITAIKGDPDDPLSRGHICPKAIALQELHNDPDRLRGPIKKVLVDGKVTWEAISWDEALDTTAEQLAKVYQQHGVDAIGVYLGNPSVHNYGMLTHQKALFRHIRTRNRYSATSVDQLPHHLASLWLFGHKQLLPIPDIDRCDYFLMLGGNPVASNGSMWTVPDIKKRIKALQARGGKLVVIDPRRTETAAIADEHHFIHPGTDALLLSALLNVILNEGLADTGHLTPFTTGLDEVARTVAPITPAFAAIHTGIAEADIIAMAKDMASAQRGICYGRMGVSVQRFGALCQWLIQVINIATGNLDREGGSLFALPAVDQVNNIGPGGFGRHRSRVRDLPEFDRELPVAALAEEITTPGDGQIRALFTGAGNPVLSTPDGRALDTALESLEFMVSLDPYLNETTRHADIILPPTSSLEHDHYDIGFFNNAIRNVARYNEPVFEKPEGSLHDWEIFSELGQRFASLLGLDATPSIPPHQMMDMSLRAGPYGESHGLSIDKLKQNPSGIDLGPLKSLLPQRLKTKDQTINCAVPETLADMARLVKTFQGDSEPSLKLIGRRHVRDCNSWMHNYHRLVKGPNRCTLLMHPNDMQARSIDDGDAVTLRSAAGVVAVEVESSEDVMPGVVSLPHGYGHHRDGIQMDIAIAHAGVSANDVTDAGDIDALSGNAVLNGVPVEVFA